MRYTDVKDDAYYMGYIEWASENGIVKGIGDKKFPPDQAITREELAVIMSNFAKAMNLKLNHKYEENTFADSTGSVVVPGCSETKAVSCPVMAFIMLDLPVFLLPNKPI
jgi:hypothetical protein